MKKFRNQRSLLLVLLCVLLSMSLVLTACGNDEETKATDPKQTVGNQPTTPNATLAPEASDPATNPPATTAPAPTEPHTHSFGDWTVETEASCVQEGQQKRVCVCGEAETRTIPMTEHTMVDGACSACGYTQPIGVEGLEYTLEDDGKSYKITGIGSCNISDIVFPETYNGLPVTAIGMTAFENCTHITSLAFPANITHIWHNAFAGCVNLENVTFSEGLKTIYSDAFMGCAKLKSVHLPATLIYIDNPFGYSGLETLTVGSGNLFYSVVNNCLIRNGSVSKGEIVIGWNGCSIPTDGSITTIESGAFKGVTSLTTLEIPSGVTRIADNAFEGCTNLTKVYMPDSVLTMWGGVFKDCSALVEVRISPNITDLGSGTFQNCSSLVRIELPKNVTELKWQVFDGCTSLQEIVIPDGLSTIGYSALRNCSSLKQLYLPKSLSSLDGGALVGCSGLESVTIDPENTYFSSVGNCVVELSSKTLLRGFANSVIPSDGSVTVIGSSAFEGCTGLTAIVIPESVTVIESYAFRGCTGLTQIVIPDSVTEVGFWAFKDCSAVTELIIGDGLTSLDDVAPGDLGALTTATVGNGITQIKKYDFFKCENLTALNLPGTITKLEESSVWNCEKLTAINFAGTMEQWNAIEKAEGWDQYSGAYTVYCTDGEIKK